MLLSRMKERYKNVPNKLLNFNVKVYEVYIRDVVNDARFTDSITQHTA